MGSARDRKVVRETVQTLRTEAIETNERRLLVLCGAHESVRTAATNAVDTGSFDGSVVTIADRDLVGEHVQPRSVGELLGTTHDCVVLDCHDACLPNALGQAVGTVGGGGLFVLLTPPLDVWPQTNCQLERMLTAPPLTADASGSRFKGRLVGTLSAHPGVAIIDVDSNRLRKDGCTDPAPRWNTDHVTVPENHRFPAFVYEACRTVDQRDAVQTCERLVDPGTAVVLEADRGRGKSSASGFAAGALASSGAEVLVTAPSFRNTMELFDRAAETLDALESLSLDGRDDQRHPVLQTSAGGKVWFQKPQAAIGSTADVLFVDEAAAIPVRTLETLLSVAPSSCFTTTVRGYEGVGRGFDVRFRERLDGVRSVESLTLSEPIRYAAADPVELWLFHALLLDSTPPPSLAVAGHSPADATYERLDRETLANEESKLREMFGLLVSAHYRTEPNDLARLLDAPNVSIRALSVDDHVVSVALLGLEGGLEESTRRIAYEGDRIDGNLIPDLLTSQLRDPDAGIPIGLRIMRIATHHAARSCGFGSRLLNEIEAEFDSNESDLFGPSDSIDYLSTSYGATPELLRFWRTNGYRLVHLSSTRNETSGEHSAVMLRPLSPAGRTLTTRHENWFRHRILDVLAGPLEAVDPDVVRGSLAATDGSISLSLSDFEWRLVASAAYGPGQYETAPGQFRQLALKTLLDGTCRLGAEAERLLVVKVLQNRSWPVVLESLGYASKGECLRALGDAFKPIVDRYGTDVARAERSRYTTE